MSDVEKDTTLATAAREKFAAIKGRTPETNQELTEWLVTDEGKAAVTFRPLPALRWGEGRS